METVDPRPERAARLRSERRLRHPPDPLDIRVDRGAPSLTATQDTPVFGTPRSASRVRRESPSSLSSPTCSSIRATSMRERATPPAQPPWLMRCPRSRTSRWSGPPPRSTRGRRSSFGSTPPLPQRPRVGTARRLPDRPTRGCSRLPGRVSRRRLDRGRDARSDRPGGCGWPGPRDRDPSTDVGFRRVGGSHLADAVDDRHPMSWAPAHPVPDSRGKIGPLRTHRTPRRIVDNPA